MNRRRFVAACFALLGRRAVAQETPVKKWYITGGKTENGFRNNCTVPPLVAYGRHPLEAIANAGITVWPEEKWKEVEPGFRETCPTQQ